MESLQSFKTFLEDTLANGFNQRAEKYNSEKISQLTDEEIQQIFKEEDELYYIISDAEMEWYEMIYGKYMIADFIRDNAKGGAEGYVLRVSPDWVKQAMEEDDVQSIFPMLAQDTTLHKVLINASRV